MWCQKVLLHIKTFCRYQIINKVYSFIGRSQTKTVLLFKRASLFRSTAVNSILNTAAVMWGLVFTDPVLSPPLPLQPPGDRSQPEQHAVPGRVRPLLRPLVSGVGDGPPDPADPPPREGRHAPVAAHGLRVQIPAGHIPTAQQEGGLRVSTAGAGGTRTDCSMF